ncbi:MAG: hypothetical protein ACLTMP_05065 [Eggerthella lenta]
MPAGAVRTDELLNASTAYPAPVGSTCSAYRPDERLSGTTRRSCWSWVRHREGRRPSSAGANLVFLIDVSGSMDDPDKLPWSKTRSPRSSKG